MDKREALEVALDAMERLLKMFSAERYVYLALSAISFLLLLYVGYELLAAQAPNKTLLLSIFGSSGLVAAASVRITYFFNRAFNLIEGLIKKLR